MTSDRPPSRLLLILAGALNQLAGAACLILSLGSIPIVHDLQSGTHAVVASAIAAVAAIVCGTLIYRGRLIPLALAMGVDIGFGVVLPRGGSALGALVRVLPADDASTAEAIITAGAITMFVAAILCAVALPSALKLRRWAHAAIARQAEQRSEELAKPVDTLRGIGPVKLQPTQIVHIGGKRRTPLVVIGVAVTLIAIGIAVISATTGSGHKAAADQGSAGSAGKVASTAHAASSADPPPPEEPPADATPALDAGAPGDAPPGDASDAETLSVFLAGFHDALGHTAAAELVPFLDARAFGFGVEANEIAEGRDAVIAQIHHDIGGAAAAEARFSQLAMAGDVGWVAEELKIGGKTFVVTLALARAGGVWSIAAIHFAAPMPNDTAYRLAHENTLGIPDAIPDTHDTSALAEAMRTAFASRPSFVEARSVRPDAFNFGSALGERIAGGDSIKKTFGRLKAVIHLHDAVAVGAIGDRGGWGAANVDFTDDDRDGGEITQTFRVLAVWLKEDAGWRIVQTQWSNPR